MARTPSSMIALGTKAPEFSLPDTVTGNSISLQQVAGSTATVIMFLCNHCPYVKHINQELVALANRYQSRRISFIAISSNDAVHYPEDSPQRMKETAVSLGYPFPYLYDETQDTARAYDAACTPDFFIYDGKMSLVYRGQLDDARPGNDIPVTGKDIRQALDRLIAGQPVSSEQRPSIGCNIKWKNG